MEKKYDLNEAAKKLGFSVLTLRRKVWSGEISYYRPLKRGKILFTEDHLKEFENRHTFKAKGA